MADGLASEIGDNAVQLVEGDSKNAQEHAPIHLRQVVEQNVQDLPKKRGLVILIHVLVGIPE